jgi:hypothetical protein
MNEYAPFLRRKCAVRKVSFKSAGDFFQADMLAYVGRTWEQWLGPLVPGLPEFDVVMSDLRPQIEELLGAS